MKFVAFLMLLVIGIPLFYFFWMIFGPYIFIIGLVAIPFGLASLYNAVYISKDNGPYEKYQVWTLDDNKKD